jgi:hypothetical protein
MSGRRQSWRGGCGGGCRKRHRAQTGKTGSQIAKCLRKKVYILQRLRYGAVAERNGLDHSGHFELDCGQQLRTGCHFF